MDNNARFCSSIKKVPEFNKLSFNAATDNDKDNKISWLITSSSDRWVSQSI